MAPAGPIRVGVVEEHEIFRLGLVASLADDPVFAVCAAQGEGALRPDVEVAVVSPEAARRHAFACPLVVCSPAGHPPGALADGNLVAGVLHRGALTREQLHASVRAARAGLRIGASADAGRLEPRALRTLELLADGRSTAEIADELAYSERTIKKLIQELEQRLSGRSRAQLVARAIRQGLI